MNIDGRIFLCIIAVTGSNYELLIADFKLHLIFIYFNYRELKIIFKY